MSLELQNCPFWNLQLIYPSVHLVPRDQYKTKRWKSLEIVKSLNIKTTGSGVKKILNSDLRSAFNTLWPWKKHLTLLQFLYLQNEENGVRQDSMILRYRKNSLFPKPWNVVGHLGRLKSLSGLSFIDFYNNIIVEQMFLMFNEWLI